MMEILEADLDLPDHQRAVVEMVNAYARDAMGDGKPLEPDVLEALIPGLREHPTTLIFLAREDRRAVGVAVCFRGFSTFAARPLVNIHDLAVLPDWRGRGVGKALLAAVERKAVELGCCRLTLEVQEDNHRARRVYASAGFVRSVHTPEAGGALFLTKPLPTPAPRRARAPREASGATLRLATSADMDRLLRLIHAFYVEDGGIRYHESPLRRALGALIGDPALGRVWLIDAARPAVGYLVVTFGYSLEWHGRDAFVDELYVEPGSRGRGAGTRALELAQAACREAGVRALHLEVERPNVRAQELYRRLGFRAHNRHLMTRVLS